MVVSVILGGLTLLVLGAVTISTVATLVNWLTLGAGLLIGLYIFWMGLNEDPLGFSSEAAAGIGYGVFGAAAAFISFRVIQAAFAAFGAVAALLVAMGIGLSLVFGFSTVLSGAAAMVQVGMDLVGGEN